MSNDVTIPQIDALQHLKSAKQVATKVATESGEAIQIMDERDSEAIVAELTGGYLEREFIYNIEYKGKGGTTQRALGLSVHAVDEICRVMGGIHTEVTVPKLITEEFIHPITGTKTVEQFYECKATTTDIITGNSISIYYHEPIWKKRSAKGGEDGVYRNEYAFQIAQSKARRNSRLAHIPKEAVRRWITEYMRAFAKDKKTKGVLRQSFEKKFLPKDAQNRDVKLEDMSSARGFVAPKKVAIAAPTQPPAMVFTEEELGISPEPVPVPTPAKPSKKKSAVTTKKSSPPKDEKPVDPSPPVTNVVEKIRDALISLGIEDSKDRKAYMEKRFSATGENIKSNPKLLENALVMLEAEVKQNRDNLRKRFFAVGTEAFGDSEEAKKIFKEKYGLESFNDATTEQITEFIEEMNGVIKLNESEGDKAESEEVPFDEESEEEASPFDEDFDGEGF